MKKEPKNKKWKIKTSEQVMSKIDDMPDQVYEEFAKLIKGIKTGKINPTKIGTPIDWVELEVKLICPECKSVKVQWLLDRNSNEATFRCLECKEGFWMTHNEYKNAVKKNPDKIIT